MNSPTAEPQRAGDTIAVYVTFPRAEEAVTVAEQIVTEGLAACANILPGATSIYRWKNELCNEPEVIAIFKTSASHFGMLAARLRSLHSYECPCIVALPHVAIDPDYKTWLLENVREQVE